MFTTIYRPKKIEDFIANKEAIQLFIRWLLEWDENDKKNKCGLVSGLCGIGKNLLVELILYKHDYNIIELSLDDERDKDYMNNIIKPILACKKTFNGQENILVVSDIDSGCDSGFITNLTDCIKNTRIPIVCICNNRYDLSIKPILNNCFDIKMSKPSYKEVYSLLYKVVTTEKIKIKEPALKELYEQSNGDIRFILNSLQFNSINNLSLIKSISNKKNIQSANIFETTSKLFSMDETINSKYEIFWLANDLHPLMIQENYINNTLSVTDQSKKMSNLAYSADALSDLDLFNKQVSMTNWEFEPYVALSAIKATSKCNKKTMIKFPQYLGKISTINKNKREKQDYDKPNILVNHTVSKPEKVTNNIKQTKPRGRPKKAK